VPTEPDPERPPPEEEAELGTEVDDVEFTTDPEAPEADALEQGLPVVKGETFDTHLPPEAEAAEGDVLDQHRVIEDDDRSSAPD
jgi:hypothetical protein